MNPMFKKDFVFAGKVPFNESGVEIGYKVKKKLYSGKSAYQKIDVFDLEFYGRALFLDGILQTALKDEFIYHEMLCQAPLFLHKHLAHRGCQTVACCLILQVGVQPWPYQGIY